VQLETLRLDQSRLSARIDENERELRARIDDQEKRLRDTETVAVQFRFLLYLSMGGGLIGLINLAVLIFRGTP
jgi:hypothetical protein